MEDCYSVNTETVVGTQLLLSVHIIQKGRRAQRMYTITAKHKGNKITRKAFSDTQASAIINRLLREGYTEIGIKEENHTEGEK